MLNSKTLEYLLNSLYAAMLSSSTNEQRLVANETLLTCADLAYAPDPGPDVLRRIARIASNEQAPEFNPPDPPPTLQRSARRHEPRQPRPVHHRSHLRLVS
jgi:hypothetical protein